MEDDFSEDSFDLREEDIEYGGSPGESPGGSPKKLTIIKAGLTPRSSSPTSNKDQSSRSHGSHSDDEDSRSHGSRSDNEDSRSHGSRSDDEDSRSHGSHSEGSRSDDTIECLSKDPLFLVLGEYLSNDKGNIVDALFAINNSLKTIICRLNSMQS